MSLPRIAAAPPYALECYVDASQLAYAAVMYVTSGGARRFLTAKCRLAPVSSPLSIPRLELMAAVMGVRLACFVASSLNMNVRDVAMFSDSQTVLWWLHTRKELKVFVANRVKEIRAATDVAQWRYIPTAMNPADLPTRGMSWPQLRDCNLWWYGPEVVPDAPFHPLSTAEAERECRLALHPGDMSVAAAVIVDPDPPPCEEAAAGYIARFSSLWRLVRVTGLLFRFVHNCKTPAEARERGPLTGREKSAALVRLLMADQAMHFPVDEIGAGRVPRRLCPLKPVVEDGLVKALPRTGEQPKTLLAPRSHLTALVVEEAHRRAFHQGVGATASALSVRYHIGRGEVKRIIGACARCRRYRSRPCVGVEAALHPNRVQFTRCFAEAGADFCGPFYCGGGKVYILLLTCFSSRAVHLELVNSLSAEDASRALRRFFALRGTPISVTSDNARTFRRLANLVPPEVEWKNIPERGPHWGGAYERLVGITKNALKITFHQVAMSFEELRVVLYELAFFINMRPLTKHADETLTPACFLYGVPTVGDLSRVVCDAPSLVQHWELRGRVIEHLRRRWQHNYLTSLRSWRRPDAKERLPAVGEVVIVQEDSVPRAQWRYGRVEELIVGRDGHARAAFVLIRGLRTRRPLHRLYRLEATAEESVGGPRPPADREEVAQLPVPPPDFESPAEEPARSVGSSPPPTCPAPPAGRAAAPSPEPTVSAPSCPAPPPSSSVQRESRSGRVIRRPARFERD